MSSSGLPALDIDPVGFGAKANSALASSMLAQQEAPMLLQQRQLQTDAMAQENQARATENQTQSQLAPLTVADAKRKSQLEEMDAANQALAQVAKDAQAADPEEAPDIWDKGMKDAAARGVTAANQYVGHYRPDLAERVGDVYGAQPAGGRAATPSAASAQDNQAVERAVAQMSNDQVGAALKRSNTLINSFNNVKDQQSWNEELQTLQDNGIDISHVLPSRDWNPMNYATAARAVKNLVPYRDALASRATILGIGGTPPAPAPLGTQSYIGTTPDTQKPVTINSVTGEETVGNVPVGPKPSAATSTFLAKQQIALANGMSQADALNFANGTKSLPPERLQAMAVQQAQQEFKTLTDPFGANQHIDNPDKWIQDKAQQNFDILSAKTAQIPGSPGGPPTGGGADLPQRALDTVKAAGGKPVRFNNGLVYKWDAKAKRAIPVK